MTISDEEAKELSEQAMETCKKIGAILAHKDREVQGAAIADIFATFIAGHHPLCRDEVRACLNKTIDGLIPINEKIMGDPWKRTAN